MKLPLKLIFKKGLVLILEFTFNDTGIKKDKFVVILNKKFNEENPIYFILPTTKVEPYKNKYQHKDHLIVKKGESKCFNKENVFDFENIMEKSYKDFENVYNNKLIQVKGILENEIIDKIDDHIKESKTIAKYIKKIILGENFKN